MVLAAFWAVAPVNDLGLINQEAVILSRREAWRVADRAIHVLSVPASAANDVVMIVTNPVFVSGGRARWLSAAKDAFFG